MQIPTTPKRLASATKYMASQGDPRVLVILNLLLSFGFSAIIVWGLDFIGIGTFTWKNVGIATVVLFLITWAVVSRR